MGRTTKATVKDAVSETVEKMNEESKKTMNQEPLGDYDEIEIVSLIPNVSYKDSKTGDFYSWDEIGHSEYMTFEVLKNMWRSHKGYFRNMWLKPTDERVINKFGLTKTFKEHEYLMNKDNYTRKNIDKVCDAIANTPNGLKSAIYDKVKNMVIDGDITDVFVIRKLENRLKLDLIEFL